jgi:hypothetical protein
MFRSAIDDLFTNQLHRISKAVTNETLECAKQSLEQNHLFPDDINRDCMKELTIILNKRYDTEVSSGRLDNYGWSTAHVRDHMHRFLQSKMKTVGLILKCFVRDGPDANIEEALRDLTMSRKPEDAIQSSLGDLDED